MITLREYQTGAIERLDERIAAGVKRIIIVAPTGSGKTTIAAWIIMRAFGRGQRVLFCAHRRELISQSYNRLMQIGIPKEMLSIMMSTDKRGRPGAPVTVASVDTLRNRDNPPADIVFVDECHRALAPTYRNISRHYSQAIHLGLTATPYRADGKGLKDAYDELLVVSSPQELIDHGYLVCPRVFAAKAPELAGIKIKQGDYDASALADAVDTKILIGNIVEHWQRLASGLRTVAFATSVQHSRNIAAQFVEHGIKAEHLDGTTPTDERDAILGRLDSGETLVVSNCGVLGEGWDQPSCKCAILARPTKSTGLYLQQAGRILRPWQGQVAIILDHAGNAIEHGLPQESREFSLDFGDLSRQKKKKRTTRPCPECESELSINMKTCPHCGYDFPVKTPEVVIQPGELQEIKAREARIKEGVAQLRKQAQEHTERKSSEIDNKREAYNALLEHAEKKGYKPGWAYHRYKDDYGEPPPEPKRTPREELEHLRKIANAKGFRPGWVYYKYKDKYGHAPPKGW